MIRSINPATGTVLRSFEPIAAETLEAKLKLAGEAAKSYPQEALEQRRFWMRRLALLLEGDREELAHTVTEEMGKPIREARAEIDKCVKCCRFYAESAAAMLEPERIPTDWQQSSVRWDPLGVVLAVMPWNFPLWQVFRFLAPALMAGNVALLKHAPNVPQCGVAIEALVRRAGFPRGACQVLLIEDATLETVVSDARVAAVTLTGSEGAGRAIGAMAGYHLKKTVLELGGSDAFIVMPSADVQAAVESGVRARCLNGGQSCIAAKRFLVHADVYDSFERQFVAAMEALQVGDPLDESTDVGPLARPDLAEKLVQQIQGALEGGGHLLTGGHRLAGQSSYMEPTVIADVSPTTPVCREETFGPLALLFRVESLEQAIQLANDTPYGLGASCWTQDSEERRRFTEELEVGSVFFNAAVVSDPRLPFGGVKHSGYGRELSAAGMREFMNAKTVVSAGVAHGAGAGRYAQVEEIELADAALALPGNGRR